MEQLVCAKVAVQDMVIGVLRMCLARDRDDRRDGQRIAVCVVLFRPAFAHMELLDAIFSARQHICITRQQARMVSASRALRAHVLVTGDDEPNVDVGPTV